MVSAYGANSEPQCYKKSEARGHFAPWTFCPTDILPRGHFAPTLIEIVDIWPQDILPQFSFFAYFSDITGLIGVKWCTMGLT